ncbi:MAG: TonB family protein [bacterium]
MNRITNPAGYPTIGAFELKRTYQRNMLIAVMVVATLWALSVAIIGLTSAAPVESAAGDPLAESIRIDVTIIPPPSVKEEPVRANVVAETPPPFVLPVASDDPTATTNFRLLDAAAYQRIAPPGLESGGKLAGYYVGTPVDEIPNPSVFVHAEKQPQPLDLPTPHYPEMARKAGMEGTVYLQVYIDSKGRVRKVMVAEASGCEIGFEEAAVEAAWRGRWSPAEQNGKSVGLWVRYPVRFRLNK